jgi:hypothetical protein
MPRPLARVLACASSADFPIPGSPRTTKAPPRPGKSSNNAAITPASPPRADQPGYSHLNLMIARSKADSPTPRDAGVSDHTYA